MIVYLLRRYLHAIVDQIFKTYKTTHNIKSIKNLITLSKIVEKRWTNNLPTNPCRWLIFIWIKCPISFIMREGNVNQNKSSILNTMGIQNVMFSCKRNILNRRTESYRYMEINKTLLKCFHIDLFCLLAFLFTLLFHGYLDLII